MILRGAGNGVVVALTSLQRRGCCNHVAGAREGPNIRGARGDHGAVGETVDGRERRVSRTERRAGRPAERGLRRQRAAGESRVTNVELFFDLVYVFAVTQLSHYLLAHQTVTGALRAGLLLVMVWLLWAYTAWVTNWLDPEQTPVRLLLLGLMLVSLVMSAGLPEAFTDGGVLVGGAYAV